MVLVSHDYKFIYLKTKKTAGTTVDAFFERFCIPVEERDSHVSKHSAQQRITDSGIIGSRRGGNSTDEWRNHKPASVVRELLGHTVFNSYLKFAVIRNPFDKAVSIYHYQNGAKHGTFVEFVQKGMLDKLAQPKRGKHTIDWYIHTLDDVPVCDVYIRFENLEHDIGALCSRLGINYKEYPLPHYKRSRRRPHYSEFYKLDNEIHQPTVDAVARFYAKEIAYFTYTFSRE